MKVLYLSRYFEPKQEFLDYISNLGYEYCRDNITLKTDVRVIKFVEDRLETLWGNDPMYKGKPSDKCMIGFAGKVVVLNVDETRTWNLRFNQTDYPFVQYIDIETDETGYTTVVRAWRNDND